MRNWRRAPAEKTRLQHRGNFEDLGDEVKERPRGVPPRYAKYAPRNRLAFARWLVSKDNPLTARVVANRFWEQVFGTGLVRTSEEFGTQGSADAPGTARLARHRTRPHGLGPEGVLKLLVTSAAYRQSSRVTPALVERDPENRLLARGPRVRLTAEMVATSARPRPGYCRRK